MGLFEDISRFLESRLEEFLKAHPDLELQALEDQLRQQEADTVRLMADARAEEKRLKQNILALAEEIKTWHQRVEKATKYKRMDLAKGAQDREAALLNQGNQLWGQMKGNQERIQQLEELYRRIQLKRQEVKEKLKSVKHEQPTSHQQWSGWTKPAEPWEDLERQFKELELEDDMQALKQKR